MHAFMRFIPILSCLILPYSFVTALTVISADQIADVFSTYLILKLCNNLRDTCVYLSILKDRKWGLINDHYCF